MLVFLIVAALFIVEVHEEDSIINSEGHETGEASTFGFMSSLNFSAFFCDCDDLFMLYIDNGNNIDMKKDVM